MPRRASYDALYRKDTSVSRFDQAKMLLKMKKLQKELQKQVIAIEKGDGAVRVEISGDQKIKKVTIDPDYVDVDDIGQLERWIEEAVKEAIAESQRAAAEKMQPMMGSLGNLGF
jgi:DNA-binding YbaB/EbfC family protein